MAVANVDRVVDAIGAPCPGPLMAVIGAIREGNVGDVIEVLSSDQGSLSDIPAWVAKAGHELLEVTPQEGWARFVVRKAR